MIKEGDRVGAIFKSDEKTVSLFGYGQYVGEEVPPPGIFFLGLDLHSMGHENPKIILDNGDIIWGCECWWGDEDQVKRDIADREVITVSINDLREKKD